MAATVTQRRAEKVLGFVAEWMGTKGYGPPHCPKGREVNHYLSHTDDDSPCLFVTFGPAPTGKDAAYNGEGPELVMDWDWSGKPTPTILLEGGPEEWAINCSFAVQAKIDAAGLPLFVEPYTSYALSIYPN